MNENSCELEESRSRDDERRLSVSFERHFTVKQVAELWHLSPDAVRHLFRNEPDVVEICRPRRTGRRRYGTLRIPESVLERVHRKLSLVKC
jgi:hypothetical protein